VEKAAGYRETTEQVKTEWVPLSHLSIEVGHFLMNELGEGRAPIVRQFRRVAPMVRAFTEVAGAEFGPSARVSTCFLVDDYFRQHTDPREVIPLLLDCAAECGVTIDYLAREAGCWEVPAFADGVTAGEPIRLAEMVAARIVAEPLPKESTGRRPPTAESGWLCNGRRSSDDEPALAMRTTPYRPAEEFGRHEHSVFLDVQMWSTPGETADGLTRWSCPFLASVWQLLRLGMLRHDGAVVVRPYPWSDQQSWPERWWEMPSVVQLNPDAHPFAAYRALSILPHRYLGIEHAVRVILDHLELDQEVIDQTVARGERESIRVSVPRVVSQRLAHVIMDGC
jgi:hypothetical protein